MMSETTPVKVAVIGASGYSGAELLRLLIMHPGAELVAVTSRQHAGTPLETVFPRFRGAPAVAGLEFIGPNVETVVATGAECAFLALPHGVAYEFAGPLLERGLRVVDLSADFRLNDAEVYREFYETDHPTPELLDEAVYGLPEAGGRAAQIAEARLVASPGCYPTSILIPTLPLLEERLIDPRSIVVSSMSGASGAGKKAAESLLFCEINESVRAYGAPKHRHLSEIEQEMSIASGQVVTISFVPHLMPVTAGITSTIFADLAEGVTPEQVASAFEHAYAAAPFVRVLGEGAFADTKHVVGTNFVDFGWVIDSRTGRLILCSAEDNVGKGASSQAIQSFNLMFGLEPTTGLLNF